MRSGDALELTAVSCSEPTQVEILHCTTGDYVHLDRRGLDDLEGILGVTPTWRLAEPRDPRYGRTPFAFAHCQEYG